MRSNNSGFAMFVFRVQPVSAFAGQNWPALPASSSAGLALGLAQQPAGGNSRFTLESNKPSSAALPAYPLRL
jgi:hypothetical protein